MIRAFNNMGRAFARLGRNLGTNFVWIGRSFCSFGKDMACAFRGCDGTDGNCCR